MANSQSSVRGVVFDLDGVIVETEELWERSWQVAAGARGYRWTAEDTAAAQGMSVPEWSAYLAERVGAPEQAEQVAAECIQRMVDAVNSGEGPLLDGAHRLVVTAGERVPIALASSAARPVIDAVLDYYDLATVFTATVSSAEVARGKPHPDVYLEAASRIGLTTPDGRRAMNGVGIEDSSNGIRAAAAAGLHVIALPNPTYPPAADALALADYVAPAHDAATDYLGQLLPPTMPPAVEEDS